MTKSGRLSGAYCVATPIARYPPAEKPMYADPEVLGTDLPRGMPDLELTEEQIDQLVAYLQTLD